MQVLRRQVGTPRALFQAQTRACRPCAIASRSVSTLPNDARIHAFKSQDATPTHVLSFLSTDPPNVHLALGSSSVIPPRPDTFTENPHVLELVHETIAENFSADPAVQAQAAAFASTGGAGLGAASSTMSFGSAQGAGIRVPSGGAATTGAGAGSAQGGMGGGGVGGWVHISDERNPPDWGRTAWPEDIFGSVQVDGNGRFVGERGGYQRSGTYRMCTHEGILKLSPYLMEKLLERLRQLERELAR